MVTLSSPAVFVFFPYFVTSFCLVDLISNCGAHVSEKFELAKTDSGDNDHNVLPSDILLEL